MGRMVCMRWVGAEGAHGLIYTWHMRQIGCIGCMGGIRHTECIGHMGCMGAWNAR